MAGDVLQAAEARLGVEAVGVGEHHGYGAAARLLLAPEAHEPDAHATGDVHARDRLGPLREVGREADGRRDVEVADDCGVHPGGDGLVDARDHGAHADHEPGPHDHGAYG